MTKDKEWVGEWFIPIRGEEVIFFGTLSYSTKTGIVLKASCDGEFRSIEHLFGDVFDTHDFPVIRGIEHISNKPIILKECFIDHSSVRTGVIITIRAGIIIENFHYTDDISSNFKSAKFQLSGLGQWLKISGLDSVGKLDKDNSNHLININYYRPENISFTIDEDFDLQISFGYSESVDKPSGIHLSEIFSVSIIAKKAEVPFHVIARMVEVFRRLMTVLFDYDCFLIKLVLYKEIIQQQEEMYGYEVYLKSDSENFPIENVSWHTMICTYDMLEEYFPAMLQKWFSYKNQDDMDYVHYVLSKYSNIFSTDMFLEKARALEVFHRATRNSLRFSDEIKNNLIKKIVDSIEFEDIFESESLKNEKENVETYNKFLEKISNNMKFINEPTFRERLKFLFVELKNKSDSIIFKRLYKDHKDLIQNTVYQRNYYTHYGNVGENSYDSEKEFSDFSKLLNLTHRMKHLLLIFVLDNIGVPPNIVMERLIEKYG